jgi:hypothetical protein
MKNRSYIHCGKFEIWVKEKPIPIILFTDVTAPLKNKQTKPKTTQNSLVCVCVCVCTRTCTIAHMWRSEDNLQESVLSRCSGTWGQNSDHQAWQQVSLLAGSSPPPPLVLCLFVCFLNRGPHCLFCLDIWCIQTSPHIIY